VRLSEPISQPFTYKEMEDALRTSAWGSDSMASVHLSGNKDSFHSLRHCPPQQITTANGAVIAANCVGTVTVRAQAEGGDSVTFQVENVFYHPDVSANLLSTGVLVKQKGWEFHMLPK